MKPSLQTRLGQQLTLTPQLRQAIRLLQLSAVELESELDLVLQSNPLLERAEELGPDDNDGAGADDAGQSDPEPVPESLQDVEMATFEDEARWEYGSPTRRGDGDYDPTEFIVAGEDLHDHLFWQLHLTHCSERDRQIGAAVIESISDDGYLSLPISEIQAGLLPEIDATQAEIEAVLCAIQHFDPVGVGARDLSECLSVQLGMLSEDTPGLVLARTLAAGLLDDLARLGADRLAQRLSVAPEAMAESVALLRSLDPKPGTRIDCQQPEYIQPDCIAWREAGVWRVALASGSQPRVAINTHYQGLIGQVGRTDASYLRGQLQEARWFLRSLDARADTLLRVARSIVRQQSGFLEHGPEAMRPLTLREVAEELGVHESTVSRASTRKYLRTPRGTFEFRHFFCSGVVSSEGGSTSATAIQAMLKRLIEGEDPLRPLSDARLASELKAIGVPVARRTVAKYREAMNIPASNERQRLA